MMNFLRQIYNQMVAVWNRLSTPQKVVVAVIPLVAIAAIVFLVVWISNPGYTILYSNLSSQDAGAIVSKLKELKAPYALTDQGAAITVPTSSVYDLRLQLASQGLPQGGGVGFEIFDRSSLMPPTDFVQKLNYQRALQGELARTIMSLEAVKRARVHLVIPQPELYADREKDTTASVVVELKPETKLNLEQIKGIIHLVSSSVEGLKKENVTVVDVVGVVLSDYVKDDLLAEQNPLKSGAGQLKLTAQQMEIRHSLEHELEKRIQSMLERVVGNNRATVRVSAVLDFDTVETQKETYEPVIANGGITRSQQKKEEKYEGIGNIPGGVPGIESNVPGYQAITYGNSRYSKNEEINNYEINKRLDHIINLPGSIKRLSVGVIVDNLQPQQVDAIKSAVIAAAGLDLARGDNIAVENMAYNTSDVDRVRREWNQEKKEAFWFAVSKIAVLFILAIFTLFLVRMILRPKEIKHPYPFIPKEMLPRKEPLFIRVKNWFFGILKKFERKKKEEPKIEEEETIATIEEIRPIEEVVLEKTSLEQQRKEQIRQKLISTATENPDIIAQVIKGWMSEEK